MAAAAYVSRLQSIPLHLSVSLHAHRVHAQVDYATSSGNSLKATLVLALEVGELVHDLHLLETV